MMLQRIFFVVLFISSGTKLCAQLNESDTLKMQLRAGISGAWQQGNVAVLTIRGRLELVSNGRKPMVFKTQNNSLYQAFGTNKADNDLSSRNYVYFNQTRKVYPFAMGYLQTNYRRQISHRWFAGAGGTFQLIRKPATHLKLSGSLVYEQTRFNAMDYNEAAYNGNDKIGLWRATAYLSGWHRLFHQRLRLYYTAYWQPGLSAIHNYRTQLDAGIDFPLWLGFNATIQYAFTHEAVVTQNTQQNDKILTFGLSYQFSKK